jgi:hypothetical protein
MEIRAMDIAHYFDKFSTGSVSYHIVVVNSQNQKLLHKMKIDWNLFELNCTIDKRETFQNLCYELFCKKFDQSEGIYANTNNKGLESDLIFFQDIFFGFQSKYFDREVTLSSRRSEIINVIDKAKNQYPNLNKLYFYSNKSFNPSSSKNKQKSKFQTELEKFAISKGLEIVWQVESQLYTQLENDRRIKLKYFSPHSKVPTAEQHLSTVRTAIIQIEIKKLEYKFDPNNWKAAEGIIRELCLYRDYKNDIVSLTIIEFLNDVADLCRHNMTSEVLYEITSIVDLFLPSKAGDEKSLSYNCIFQAIYIGYSLAYDSIIKLNNLDMLRSSLQFWKNIHHDVIYSKDERIIDELYKNQKDLRDTVENRNRKKFNYALELIDIYMADLKKPVTGAPILPDELYSKIVQDRNSIPERLG